MPIRGNQFLSIEEVDRFLSFCAPEVRDIALELRNTVAAACPHATERILWRGLSYHDAARGGPVKGAICQIELDRQCVRLGFIHGVRLSDPHSLLVGDRLSKRYLELNCYDTAPWSAIRSLIEEAAALLADEFGPLP